ncbi:MAG TPA: type II CAAX endopeptidase family protein [Clostridia bacterium]|nr:type II CAAX endopeptidase family protein [Clostridia bacterium]
MDSVPIVSPHDVSVPTPRYPAIAPWWHTISFVIILLVFSAAGAAADHTMSARHGRWVQYAVTMAWEWILFGYVWFGIRRSGIGMRELIGGRWKQVEDFLLDVALAFGFWIVALGVLAALGYAMHLTGANKLEEARRQLGFLVPRTGLEVSLWIALSCTAGICEEVIFRGYLQRQLSAFTRNAWVGIFLSGIVFGAGHGYEGARRMVLIAIYGMMFGILTHARKSLRPGMMAHAAHDVFTGLALRFLMK